MSFTVERTGSAAAVVVKMRRGERVKAEPDALVTMSQHVQLGAALDSGLFAGLIRMLFGGEALFVQTVQAQKDGSDATFCADEVGDIELLELQPDGGDILLQKGCFLAAHESVEVTTAAQRSASKALFSGAGLFVLRASGTGTLAVNAMGGILKHELRAGETRAVDNGHLVAWDASLRYDVRMGAQRRGFAASAASSAVSGEGIMCFFEGPGRLWLQTHKPRAELGGGRAGRGGRSGRPAQAGPALLVVLFALILLVVGVAAAAAFVAAQGSDPSRGDGGGRRAAQRAAAAARRGPSRHLEHDASPSPSYSAPRNANGKDEM